MPVAPISVAHDFPSEGALPPDIEVRFVHEETCSMAFVRRRDRGDAEGYDLRLKSWDDPRAARDVIESNLIARLRRAYTLPSD